MPYSHSHHPVMVPATPQHYGSLRPSSSCVVNLLRRCKQIDIAYIKIIRSARNLNKSISISSTTTSARISNRGCDDVMDRQLSAYCLNSSPFADSAKRMEISVIGRNSPIPGQWRETQPLFPLDNRFVRVEIARRRNSTSSLIQG